MDNPTLVQNIRQTAPVTHVFCLENYDTVTRTFTIDTSSSQGWQYAYSYLAPTQVEVTAGLPFTFSVGPATSSYPFAGVANIRAVYTPTASVDDAIRETLAVTATSVVSPSVRASSSSFALGSNYRLNEGSFTVYLPGVLRE